MKRPQHLAELNVSRKRQAMTERLRREVRPRVRVKAVGRHIAAAKTRER